MPCLSASGRHLVLLCCLADPGNLMAADPPAQFPPGTSVAERLRSLTDGAHVKCVWVQRVEPGGDEELKGQFRIPYRATDHDAVRYLAGPAVIEALADPLFTRRGDRVIYSDLQAKCSYIVDVPGGKPTALWEASRFPDCWRVTGLFYDEQAKEEFAIARSGDDHGVDSGGPPATFYRVPLDRGPVAKVLLWNKTHLDGRMTLSRDLKRFGGAFPWPFAGVAVAPNGPYKPLNGGGPGCESSMAPDNSYLFMHFEEDHTCALLYEPQSGAAGLAYKPGRKLRFDTMSSERGAVHTPRWTNAARYITCSSPESLPDEVWLGRFDAPFTRIEAWVNVSQNDQLCDRHLNVWISTGVIAPSPATPAKR